MIKILEIQFSLLDKMSEMLNVKMFVFYFQTEFSIILFYFIIVDF